MAEQSLRLRALYSQIIQGSTPFDCPLKGPSFIKHGSPLEQGALDTELEKYANQAVAKGAIREADKLQQLQKEGAWTEKDEKDVDNRRSTIRGMRETKRGLMLPSQVKKLTEQIAAEETILQEKEAAREGHLGMTAEKWARRKINEQYIWQTLYADKACHSLVFSPEEFDELDGAELGIIVQSFNAAMDNFGGNMIQRIALAPFFQNIYSLCEDNIYHLYGKPIVQLTSYQSELAMYGRYFKSILQSENRPPADVLEDPDKLMDWQNATTNSTRVLSQHNGSNVAVVGGTEEDLQAIAGKNDNVVSLNKVMEGKEKLRGVALMKMLKQQ